MLTFATFALSFSRICSCVITFFLNGLMVICRHEALLRLLYCVYLKNKDILLYNNNIVIKNQEIKHWYNTIIYYPGFFQILPVAPIRSFGAKENPRLYIVSDCPVPLLSFHLDQLLSFFVFHDIDIFEDCHVFFFLDNVSHFGCACSFLMIRLRLCAFGEGSPGVTLQPFSACPSRGRHMLLISSIHWSG